MPTKSVLTSVPHEGGAEATAVQTLSRLTCGLKPRAAPGLRAVYRRSRLQQPQLNPQTASGFKFPVFLFVMLFVFLNF